MAPPRILDPHVSLAAFFGAETRRHRCRMRWTQQQLAERIVFGDALVAKVERAERLPPDGFGAACDTAFELPGVLHELEELTRAAPSWFTRFVVLEGRATKISVWDMRLVPGLLQTEAYARAIIAANEPRADEDRVAAGARDRLARQVILNRPDPPVLNVVLDESVVRRSPGDVAVMREQLAHLRRLADHRTVLLRVLPFARGGLIGAKGPFFIFEFDDQPPVGIAEASGGGRIVDGAELSDLSLMYDRIADAALTAEQTSGLLMGAMDAAWTYTP